MILKKYMVFCIALNSYVKTDYMDTVPTKCPQTGGEIDPERTTIIDVIDDNTITIKEPTTGWFQCTTVLMDIPAGEPGTVTKIDTEFPMDIQLWKSDLVVKQNMVGDSICLINNPDQSVGYITDDVLIGDTVFTVNDTVLSNIIEGVDITLTDKINTCDLGRVVDIDITKKEITVEKPSKFNFYHSGNGSLVLINFCMIRNYILDNPNIRTEFGSKGFRQASIAKKTKLRLVYTNNNGEAKQFNFKIEYYFGTLTA